MEWEQRCIRLCAGVLLCAILLRLVSGGALAQLGRALEQEGTASLLLYLHTGRVVRLRPEQPGETTPAPTEPRKEAPRFLPEDAEDIGFHYSCSLRPDAESLMAKAVELNLTGEGPRVLILHTHTTESFTPTGSGYEETSPYRTLDPEHNMLALGQLVAEQLEAAGIGVVHDTTFHDYPSYNGAYNDAYQTARACLQQYPTIELILDLHRDAADTPAGQMATRCDLDGQSAAQLMFVVGTDERLEHPDWEANLSLALKLQHLLQTENPGICRDIHLTNNRYNQHLGKYALLVEIGAAGNTLDQAKPAARELAEAIIRLAG